MAADNRPEWTIYIGVAPDDRTFDGIADGVLVKKRISVRVAHVSADNVIKTIAAADLFSLKTDEGTWWVIGDRRIIRSENHADSRDLADKSILAGILVCLCHSSLLNHIVLTPPPEALADPVLWMVKMQALGFRPLTPHELAKAPFTTSAIAGEGPNVRQTLYCPDEHRMPTLTAQAEAFLARASVHGPANETTPQTRSAKAAARVKKLLRAHQTNASIELEIVTIDHTWPLGELGGFLLQKNGEIDGICARMICTVDGDEVPLGRGRAYHIRGSVTNGDWWIFGDPMVAHLARKNRLHEKLIAGRAVHCLLGGARPNRIVLAPGRYAAKAPGLGFREMRRTELRGAPTEILALAEKSKAEYPESHSGLYCIDRHKIPTLVSIAADLTKDGTIAWQLGNNSVPRTCGTEWRLMIELIRTWLKLPIEPNGATPRHAVRRLRLITPEEAPRRRRERPRD